MAKKKEIDPATIVHKTKVRIHMPTLNQVCDELKTRYEEIGNRDSYEGRSRFSAWNNIRATRDRIISGEHTNLEGSTADAPIIEITGTAKGNSARVYYHPSITSLAKPFRKAVIPIDPNKKFIFFDLKAAEFFMNCVFCGMQDVYEAYHRGEDIYMNFKHLFPQGTERKVVKKILIANMYNQRAYSVSKDLGISETQAQRLLDNLAFSIMPMTKNKQRVIAEARRANAYLAQRGFSKEIVEVAKVNPDKGFSDDLALSARVQSALGFFMQDYIKRIDPKISGTLLTVFDSSLCEINPESVERFRDFIKRAVHPFLPGDFGIADNFYDAQEQAG